MLPPEGLRQPPPEAARLPEGEDGRTTRADRSGDRGTPLRRLDEPLCLVVRHEPGGRWGFPALEYANGGGDGGGGGGEAPLRATAERALEPFLEEDGRVQFVGNAPAGALRTGKDGGGAGEGHTFLFMAKLLGGGVRLGAGAEAHWISRDEVGDYFSEPADRDLVEAVLPCELSL